MGSPPVMPDLPGWTPTILGRRSSGKLTDSQDSFRFWYRKIDPRRKHFRLSATFEVEDASGVNFQTGYGIMAVDTVASLSTFHRHRNQALVGRFRDISGNNYAYGLRIVGGYTDRLARPQDGRRLLDPSRIFPTQESEPCIRKGDRRRFTLAKTDSGLEASMETASGVETLFFPGCDFLMKQDKCAIYVGFAIAGDIGLKITDICFETSPGRLSRTPEGAIGHFIPDYPFDRNLLPDPPQAGVRLRDTELTVSPDGNPLTLSAALRQAGPGCEIILSDGVYTGEPYYIPESASGEPDKPVILRAEHPGKAVIDGTGLSRKLPGMTLRAGFWILDGVIFRNAPASGLFVCGSDNVIRNCEAFGNADTGILLCAFPGTTKESWPGRNRIENCFSHDNCDPVRCNADGFGAKLSVGTGNGFYHCKAFHNIDDGFDLYTKSTLGPISPVVLEDCEAAFNGWLASEKGPGAQPKTGIGFKLGGEGQRVRHLLKDCAAHDNARDGFDANSNPSCRLIRCSTWNNPHS